MRKKPFSPGEGKTEVDIPFNGGKRRFFDLLPHTAEIVRDPPRIEAFQAYYGVLKDCFPVGLPEKDELLEIYGRVLINSFNVMNEDYQSVGIGLYLAASVLDHSCVPNAAVVFDGLRLKVRVTDPDLKSISDIRDLRISYTHLLNETEMRRKELREQYYFTCDCDRCQGDYEQGKEQFKLNCAKCPDCNGPVAVKGDKTCGKCGREMTKKETRRFRELKEEVIDKCFRNKGGHPEPMELSYDFVAEGRDVFHPCDKLYLDLLEYVFQGHFDKADWEKAMEVGLVIIEGYKVLYPRNDVNTALLHLKIGKMANYLTRLAVAFEHLTSGMKILEVTHGSDHPLCRNTVLPMLEEIRYDMRVMPENSQKMIR